MLSELFPAPQQAAYIDYKDDDDIDDDDVCDYNDDICDYNDDTCDCNDDINHDDDGDHYNVPAPWPADHDYEENDHQNDFYNLINVYDGYHNENDDLKDDIDDYPDEDGHLIDAVEIYANMNARGKIEFWTIFVQFL